MKVALHTVDLFPGRERLMPFRTILEVAKVMVAHGWEADILNSSVSEKNAEDFVWQGVKILQCPRDFIELSKWVNTHEYDAFCFAATIREGLKQLSGLQNIKCYQEFQGNKIMIASHGIVSNKEIVRMPLSWSGVCRKNTKMKWPEKNSFFLHFETDESPAD